MGLNGGAVFPWLPSAVSAAMWGPLKSRTSPTHTLRARSRLTVLKKYSFWLALICSPWNVVTRAPRRRRHHMSWHARAREMSVMGGHMRRCC